MERFTLEQLESMPTIGDTHFDDVKVEENGVRVCLSRCTVADGEPYDNKVTVEKLTDGRWTIVDQYPAGE